MSARPSRSQTTAGTGILLRFLLRLDRFRLPWWLLGAALLVGYQSAGSQSIYDTPEDLAKLRETMGGNVAVVAMSGPTQLLATIGGEVVFEIFSYVAVVVALMNMFLVGRHTRTDEETGRAELVRSARDGWALMPAPRRGWSPGRRSGAGTAPPGSGAGWSGCAPPPW